MGNVEDETPVHSILLIILFPYHRENSSNFIRYAENRAITSQLLNGRLKIGVFKWKNTQKIWHNWCSVNLKIFSIYPSVVIESSPWLNKGYLEQSPVSLQIWFNCSILVGLGTSSIDAILIFRDLHPHSQCLDSAGLSMVDQSFLSFINDSRLMITSLLLLITEKLLIVYILPFNTSS